MNGVQNSIKRCWCLINVSILHGVISYASNDVLFNLLLHVNPNGIIVL